MTLSDIQETYDPNLGTPDTAALVLTVTVGGAEFQGVGLTFSKAMERLLHGVKEWRDRLNDIPDGYLNEKTLALKSALNEF